MTHTYTIKVAALFAAALTTLAVLGCETKTEPTPITGNNNPKTGTQIGYIAPEIVGKDLEGKEFKLSDYRGKVVMLDFWAGW